MYDQEWCSFIGASQLGVRKNPQPQFQIFSKDDLSKLDILSKEKQIPTTRGTLASSRILAMDLHRSCS